MTNNVLKPLSGVFFDPPRSFRGLKEHDKEKWIHLNKNEMKAFPALKNASKNHQFFLFISSHDVNPVIALIEAQLNSSRPLRRYLWRTVPYNAAVLEIADPHLATFFKMTFVI